MSNITTQCCMRCILTHCNALQQCCMRWFYSLQRTATVLHALYLNSLQRAATVLHALCCILTHCNVLQQCCMRCVLRTLCAGISCKGGLCLYFSYCSLPFCHAMGLCAACVVSYKSFVLPCLSMGDFACKGGTCL